MVLKKNMLVLATPPHALLKNLTSNHTALNIYVLIISAVHALNFTNQLSRI